MNIMVVSPHTHRNGNTTVASLVALELAARGQKVCLTHLNTKSFALKKYFKLDDVAHDKSCDPSKLTKLIKQEVIRTEEICNYCRNVTKDLDVLSVNDKKLDGEDLSFLINYTLSSFPYEMMVYDVDVEDYETDLIKNLTLQCDFVVMVVTQSLVEVMDFKDVTTKLSRIFAKPGLAVINKFDRQVSTVRDVRSEVGTGKISKNSSWLMLRYNPQIVKFANSGQLQYLTASMKRNDYALLDIAGDMSQIASRIMKFNHRYKAQIARNKADIREKELKAFQDGADKRQREAAETEAAEEQANAQEEQASAQEITAEAEELSKEQREATAEAEELSKEQKEVIKDSIAVIEKAEALLGENTGE